MTYSGFQRVFLFAAAPSLLSLARGTPGAHVDSPPGEVIKSDSYAEQLDNETRRHPLQAVNKATRNEGRLGGWSGLSSVLHQEALALADRMTRMARRASVDRRGSVGCVLRNVRRDVEVAQIVDEIAHIESLIGAELRRRAPRE